MSYDFQLKGYKKTEKGVILQVFVPHNEIVNEITKFKVQNNILTGELKFDDGRLITAKQKKRIYLTIKDIADYLGYFESEMEQLLIENFNITYNENLKLIPNASISVARKFIAYLLEFVLKYDIRLSDYALNRIDNIESYISLCLKYRKCCICGNVADIHHALDDRVQMGNNRNKINHVGRKVIPLCRCHHTELHSMSENEFYKKYSIKPIPLTKEMADKIKI